MAAVRAGLAKVVPVPLLSLFSGYELETMVCGSPDIPLELLKSVAVYKGMEYVFFFEFFILLIAYKIKMIVKAAVFQLNLFQIFTLEDELLFGQRKKTTLSIKKSCVRIEKFLKNYLLFFIKRLAKWSSWYFHLLHQNDRQFFLFLLRASHVE